MVQIPPVRMRDGGFRRRGIRQMPGPGKGLCLKLPNYRPAVLPTLRLSWEVLQFCGHPVIGWQDAPPGIFGLWSIQVATI